MDPPNVSVIIVPQCELVALNNTIEAKNDFLFDSNMRVGCMLIWKL
jgi:hypothetical protein